MSSPPEKIGVIGLGRLGLCLALNLEQAGFHVLGLDLSQDYIDQLNDGSFQSPEPGVTELLAKTQNFEATIDWNVFNDLSCPLLFVVVPTNSLPDGGYDHSHIENVIESLEKLPRPEQRKTLVINCTTMPGYCESIKERVKQLNYNLVYNPEFIAQGSILQDQLHPDQVLIGAHEPIGEAQIISIYKQMCQNKPEYCTMSLTSAEITKLATNCFLTMKISFANAIGDLAQVAGANPKDVLNAIGSDSRIGNKYLKHGFGYGGPCFPRDNKALTRFAEQVGYPLHLSTATEKVNQEHLDHQFSGFEKRESPIIFDHVTYKPGTDILEESQQLALAVKLAKAGKQVVILESEPVIAELQKSYGKLFTYKVHPA